MFHLNQYYVSFSYNILRLLIYHLMNYVDYLELFRIIFDAVQQVSDT